MKLEIKIASLCQSLYWFLRTEIHFGSGHGSVAHCTMLCGLTSIPGENIMWHSDGHFPLQGGRKSVSGILS